MKISKVTINEINSLILRTVSQVTVLLLTVIFVEFTIHLIASVVKIPTIQIRYLQNMLKSSSQSSYTLGLNSDEKDNVELNFKEAHILHPYIGFVGDSKKSDRYNSYGFVGENPIQKKSPDKLIIGIFGGSVAEGLYGSTDVITSELSKNPLFQGKKISVNLYGFGGFKQPQQLMTLSYLLSMGSEFDIIINLDGFNEIALPYAENIPMGLNPVYPRSWKFYTQKENNIFSTKETGYLFILKDLQDNWDKLFAQPPINNSVIMLNLWLGGSKVLRNFQYQHTLALEKGLSQESNIQSDGPNVSFQSSDDIFKYSADIWANSSVAMNDLAIGQGVHYFHFLQPNQYVASSKIFTSKENKYAISADNTAFKTSVQKGYKFLMEKSSWLNSKGVNFTDLTMIFKYNPSTLYIDMCCHFNKEGEDAVARKIVSVINQSISKTDW